MVITSSLVYTRKKIMLNPHMKSLGILVHEIFGYHRVFV